MTYDDRRRRLAALEGFPIEDVTDLRAGQGAFWNMPRRAAPDMDATKEAEARLLAALPEQPTRDAVLTLLVDYYAEHTAAIPCARCGYPCQLAPKETDRPDVTLLRGKSTEGTGVCASCNITAFLQDETFPFGHMLREMGPDKRQAALTAPQMQQGIADLVRMQPGGVGLSPELIVWERVLAFWDLPHPPGTYGKGRKGRKRKGT